MTMAKVIKPPAKRSKKPRNYKKTSRKKSAYFCGALRDEYTRWVKSRKQGQGKSWREFIKWVRFLIWKERAPDSTRATFAMFLVVEDERAIRAKKKAFHFAHRNDKATTEAARNKAIERHERQERSATEIALMDASLAHRRVRPTPSMSNVRVGTVPDWRQFD